MLICIAFHFAPERIRYLKEVIENILDTYPRNIEIVVDTNTHQASSFFQYDAPITFFVHETLSHPFHLTWMHRQHFQRHIDNFDVFMYIEDDIKVPYAGVEWFLEMFPSLWPKNIPSFIRIESKDDDDYITDVFEPVKLKDKKLIKVYDKTFYSFKPTQNYHGFWLLPRQELKDTMTRNFARLSDSRETAASYAIWELNKRALVEIYEECGRWYVHPNCYTFHLPNNYATNPGTHHGKIKLENIFI